MGRPRLRIGEAGAISRNPVRPGVWEARCWVRDPDGRMRRVGRQSPRDVYDRHGASAEDVLREHLRTRNGGTPAEITLDTLVSDLLAQHLTNLKNAGRALRTMDTYTARVAQWNAVGGGLRVQDATPGVVNATLERLRGAHGATTAKQARTLVTAALDLAVNAGALQRNPAREALGLPQPHRSMWEEKGAPPLDPALIPDVMDALAGSDACKRADLTDVMLVHLGTGLRVGEVMGLRWTDLDPDARIIAVRGRVVRVKGQGVLWVPITATSTKRAKSEVTLPPPTLAALLARAADAGNRPNKHDLIFPSTVGGFRDPNIVARQWRKVRGTLGIPELENVTGHSFRKAVGTLVAEGAGDRVAADALGHADPTTTLRHYLMRNRAGSIIADILEDAMTRKPDTEPETDT